MHDASTPHLSVVPAVLPVARVAAGAALSGVKQRVAVVVSLRHPHVHPVGGSEVGERLGACKGEVLAVASAWAPVNELAALRVVGEVARPHKRVAGHCGGCGA